MKKTMLILLGMVVLLLSACSTYDNYEYDTNKIESINDLGSIINNMMENGEHNNVTEVQYDLVSGVLTYNKEGLFVDSILYNVYTGTKNNTHEFDNFQCRSVNNGKLACTESKLSQEVLELKQTITLGEIKDMLSTVNIDELTNTLSSEFSFLPPQNTIISFHFERFTGNSIELGESDEKINIYQGEDLSISGTQYLNGIVMVMNIAFINESGAKVFELYVD